MLDYITTVITWLGTLSLNIFNINFSVLDFIIFTCIVYLTCTIVSVYINN